MGTNPNQPPYTYPPLDLNASSQQWIQDNPEEVKVIASGAGVVIAFVPYLGEVVEGSSLFGLFADAYSGTPVLASAWANGFYDTGGLLWNFYDYNNVTQGNDTPESNIVSGGFLTIDTLKLMMGSGNPGVVLINGQLYLLGLATSGCPNANH